MICGGAQTVLLYACQHNELELYQQLANAESITLTLSPLGFSITDCARLLAINCQTVI